jgi:hypothetical protein
MTAALDHAALDRLVRATPTAPVLSVYLRTDPREAANARSQPAWRAALGSGMKEVGGRLTEREHRLAYRALHDELLADVAALGADRARSIAWFVALDGSVDERFSAQLALPASSVHLDVRPVVAPAVDLVERGAPTAIVLVGRERVRVLDWAHGAVEEASDLVLDVDRTDYPEHRGSAGSARHRPTVAHSEHVEARDEQQRDRFLAASAAAIGDQLARAERVVLVATGGLAPRLRRHLPEPAVARIRLVLDLNLAGLPAAEVAARVEPHLEALHRSDALALADALRTDGAAAGAPEVLTALAQRQVETLLIDPLHVPDTSTLPPIAAETLDGAGPELAGERAVEAALGAGARIETLAVADSPALAEADGMLARLRW